jgi:hypothetical protein
MKTLICILFASLVYFWPWLSLKVYSQEIQPSSDQVVQPSRYEVELKWGDEFFDVISAEENGILMIRKNLDLDQRNEMAWQVIVLDTTLNER